VISTDAYTKISFSGGDGCVEVCFMTNGMIAVRDSKDVSKSPHFFTSREWEAFLAGVRNGEFDLGPSRYL
jgi:hypothetical protein